MRILFHVTTTAMLRHFTSVIRALAKRGHIVRIASPERRADLLPPEELLDRDGIEFVSCPELRSDAWGRRVYELRALRDYLRYTDGALASAPKLRARALSKLVKSMTDGQRSSFAAQCPRCHDELSGDEAARLLVNAQPGGRSRLDSLLELAEASIPSDPGIETFLRHERPDLLIVTPLIKIGSYQADYVKSARALGVPVVFPVFSWDNLTTKGLVHVMPDRVLVWNDVQRDEAVRLHHVPADRVVVTGAPRFDEFFAMRPKMPRERFCRRLRLDPGQPILTYLCSSKFVAKEEREFVLRWIAEVRRSPALASCNIVIRPHPREKTPWKKFRKRGLPRVAVSFPDSISVDQRLYDTVHHSAALVGLNTSAQLEAGIVGRPVLTILAPEFSAGQQGTIHFQYLLKDAGGYVEVAPDFDVHRQHLEEAIAGRYDADAIRGFIERFLRPRGIGERATPIMVDAIEQFAHSYPDRSGRMTRGRSRMGLPLAWLRRHVLLPRRRRGGADVVSGDLSPRLHPRRSEARPR